jgi:mono/diheme cytochrome c family protein
MTSTVVVAVVAIAAFVWVAVLVVSALRSRGQEEIPSNLAPGEPDEVMETRRLERTQQAAVLLSAFLAVGLPLYYLGEANRQDQFEEDFALEAEERGAEHWVEFQCGNCHGAGGVGGSAQYVEKRSGVSVAWTAPSVNDVFLRYDRESVAYWLTYGRANTPMPAWGVDGGGPMTSQQIEELLDYMESEEFQVTQDEAVAAVGSNVTGALSSLEAADGAVANAIVNQRQVLADLERAPVLTPVLEGIAERATQLADRLGEGIDTDGDGVSDSAEEEVNQITAETRQALLPPGLELLTFDPANPETFGVPDAERAAELVTAYTELGAGEAPLVGPLAEDIQEAIDSTEGGDGDGDGLTDSAESAISAVTTTAANAVLPATLVVTTLDPSNPETIPEEPDLTTAGEALNEISIVFTNIRLNSDNGESLVPAAEASLDRLLAAQRNRAWDFDIETIADTSFEGDVARAERVVGVFQAYCARCHTSGFSAGLPFTQTAGSGAFGPAIFEGRPALNFLTDEDLRDFLIVGTVANQPYGINGMGKPNAPMPGFGRVLSEQDLTDLAIWLRDGDLTGMGEES